jgi:hypothetical protein
MERMVDRYLSIRIPIRRYEFMTQIKVQPHHPHHMHVLPLASPP